MRHRTHSLLLASIAAVIAAFAWWHGPGREARAFYLEAELASARPGRVQVYFDRGQGFREPDSSSHDLPVGSQTERVRLPLPEGTLRALRLDPTDQDATVVIAAARIVDGLSRTRREFRREDCAAPHQIAALVGAAKGWEVRPEPGANDAYFELRLEAPLVLAPDWSGLALAASRVMLIAGALGWGLGWLVARPALGPQSRPSPTSLLPPGHSKLIDEIKGVAMLLVLLYHTGGILGWNNNLHGEVGVDVFLIVTGVMLAARSTTLSLRDFLRRRFFRILPPYWLALALFLILHRVVFGSFFSWTTVVLHALGIHGFVAEDHFFAINDSFWFISLLIGGYATFIAVRNRLEDLSFLAGVGGLLTAVACVTYAESGHQAGLIHLAIRIPSFFTGLILGQVLSGRPWRLRLDGWLALGLGSIGYLTLYRGIFLGYLVAALAIIALTAVVNSALRPLTWLRAWPALLGWIGSLSYEIYLLHQPLMRDYSREALKRWLGLTTPTTGQQAFACGAAFIGVVLIAWLLHHAMANRRDARTASA